MRKKEELLLEKGSRNFGTDYEEINPAGQTFCNRVTSESRKGPSPVFLFIQKKKITIIKIKLFTDWLIEFVFHMEKKNLKNFVLFVSFFFHVFSPHLQL